MPRQKKQRYHNNLRFNFSVKKSGIEGAGNGLFAEEYIPNGTIIGFYECHWNFQPRTGSNYSFYVNDRILLDIDFEDMPYSALINDALDSDFVNNVEAVFILTDSELNGLRKKRAESIDPNTMVKLVAIKDIKPGNELFFSYGRAYWKEW